MIHNLLQKHLAALGIDAQIGPQDKETWHKFLYKISHLITDYEQHRYLINRSLEISSREMQARWHSLKLLEEQWRSLGECSPDLIIMVDLKGKITFANRSKSLRSKESLIGVDVLTLYPRSLREKLQDLIETSKFEKAVKCIEIQVESDHGDCWYSIRAKPVIKEGTIEGAVIVETDVTEVRNIAVGVYLEALNFYRDTEK